MQVLATLVASCFPGCVYEAHTGGVGVIVLGKVFLDVRVHVKVLQEGEHARREVTVILVKFLSILSGPYVGRLQCPV